MGSNQSTRRISIDNDGDPSSIIKVSESVVKRLKLPEKAVPSDSQPDATEEEDADKPNVRRPTFHNYRYKHVPVPDNMPIQSLPYITSKDIQQELEKEIQKNNEYWEKRLQDLQKTHEKMNRIMEEEYVKATDEMEKFMPRVPPANGKMPCQGGRANVTKCYKDHPRQPLNCSHEVELFASCMTNTRIQLQKEGKLS